jgi:hypothetical protein
VKPVMQRSMLLRNLNLHVMPSVYVRDLWWVRFAQSTRSSRVSRHRSNGLSAAYVVPQGQPEHHELSIAH